MTNNYVVVARRNVFALRSRPIAKSEAGVAKLPMQVAFFGEG